MVEQEIAAVLQASVFFRKLSDDAIRDIAALAVTTTYTAGNLIVAKGEPGDRMMIVAAGRVKITANSPFGQEAIINILEYGDTVGEVSVFDGHERSADVIALEDSTLVVIRKRDLLECIRRYPETAIEMLRVLCGRLRTTTTLLEGTLFLSVGERLLNLVETLARRYGTVDGPSVLIQHGLSQEQLGQSIGASRESVNKQLGEWQEQGLIAVGRGYLLVHDMQRLRAALQRGNALSAA